MFVRQVNFSSCLPLAELAALTRRKLLIHHVSSWKRSRQRIFISDDHLEFLSFDDNHRSVQHDFYGKQLKVDIQGMAILRSEWETMQRTSRRRREAATTEEIATELSAEEYLVQQKMLNLLRLLCPTILSSKPDATLTARRLMNKKDVMGKWRSPSILEVFHCATIHADKIRLRQIVSRTAMLAKWS